MTRQRPTPEKAHSKRFDPNTTWVGQVASFDPVSGTCSLRIPLTDDFLHEDVPVFGVPVQAGDSVVVQFLGGQASKPAVVGPHAPAGTSGRTDLFVIASSNTPARLRRNADVVVRYNAFVPGGPLVTDSLGATVQAAMAARGLTLPFNGQLASTGRIVFLPGDYRLDGSFTIPPTGTFAPLPPGPVISAHGANFHVTSLAGRISGNFSAWEGGRFRVTVGGGWLDPAVISNLGGGLVRDVSFFLAAARVLISGGRAERVSVARDSVGFITPPPPAWSGTPGSFISCTDARDCSVFLGSGASTHWGGGAITLATGTGISCTTAERCSVTGVATGINSAEATRCTVDGAVNGITGVSRRAVGNDVHLAGSACVGIAADRSTVTITGNSIKYARSLGGSLRATLFLSGVTDGTLPPIVLSGNSLTPAVAQAAFLPRQTHPDLPPLWDADGWSIPPSWTSDDWRWLVLVDSRPRLPGVLSTLPGRSILDVDDQAPLPRRVYSAAPVRQVTAGPGSFVSNAYGTLIEDIFHPGTASYPRKWMPQRVYRFGGSVEVAVTWSNADQISPPSDPQALASVSVQVFARWPGASGAPLAGAPGIPSGSVRIAEGRLWMPTPIYSSFGQVTLPVDFAFTPSSSGTTGPIEIYAVVGISVRSALSVADVVPNGPFNVSLELEARATEHAY